MGLCILEVYKDGKQPPNNLSSIRDISQWYESLAIPSDYQLVPKGIFKAWSGLSLKLFRMGKQDNSSTPG